MKRSFIAFLENDSKNLLVTCYSFPIAHVIVASNPSLIKLKI